MACARASKITASCDCVAGESVGSPPEVIVAEGSDRPGVRIGGVEGQGLEIGPTRRREILSGFVGQADGGQQAEPCVAVHGTPPALSQA